MKYKTPSDKNIPVVQLFGSDPWEEAYTWGGSLEQKFPEQDGDNFAMAVHYNDAGPLKEANVVSLVMDQEGVQDGQEWIWSVELDDGTTWLCTAWCDYTGWDCQSGLHWKQDFFV